MNWVSLLGAISIWIIMLPLLIGLIIFRWLDTDSKWILAIVVIGSIPQLLSQFNIGVSVKNVLYNVYTPLEFTVYWMIFSRKIYASKLRFAIKATAVLFFICSTILIARFSISARFLNEWVIINNLIQIVWVSICLLEFYYRDEAVIEKEDPFFWFLIGITCYSSCTVVFYSLWYFIKVDEHGQFHVLVVIHHFFNILLYCFFTAGLLQNLRVKNKAPDSNHLLPRHG